MNNTLIYIAVVIACAMSVIWLIFTPYRCPKCKSKMDDFYDNRGNSWKVCPKCGHEVWIGEEDEDD